MQWLSVRNEEERQDWLAKVLGRIQPGLRILDAGAGELKNHRHCHHLDYVSQDFCQYDGKGNSQGLQTGTRETGLVDLVCDIVSIPEPDASFDVILCSEVFERVPDPVKALDELVRLLKPDGVLILTAPFASLVHYAPYHFCTGFSRYWYEHHLPAKGLVIKELSANGDWFSCCQQELRRLGSIARLYGDPFWPLAYGMAVLGAIYFRLGYRRKADDLACLGWHCLATKSGN